MSITRTSKVIATLAAGLTVVILSVPTSAGATGTLDQSQTSFGANLFGLGTCGTASVAQTFTPGISGALDQVDVGAWSYPSNSATALQVEIYAASGGVPAGTALASASVPTSELATFPSDGGFVPVTFASAASITAGKQYAIVLERTNLPCFSGFFWTYVEGDVYTRGEGLERFEGQPWIRPTFVPIDFTFRTYVTPPPLPVSTEQCKNGGWKTFKQFKNQGDCVSFVASAGRNGSSG